jgi:gas vesicle protein
MTSNHEFQPPSLSEYVSLRAESAVEASVKRAMEPFMSELRTFKVDMKAEMKEFKAEMKEDLHSFKAEMKAEMKEFKTEMKVFKAEVKEDLRDLKRDVADLKNDANFRRTAVDVVWDGLSLICMLSGGGFAWAYLWDHAKR